MQIRRVILGRNQLLGFICFLQPLLLCCCCSSVTGCNLVSISLKDLLESAYLTLKRESGSSYLSFTMNTSRNEKPLTWRFSNLSYFEGVMCWNSLFIHLLCSIWLPGNRTEMILGTHCSRPLLTKKWLQQHRQICEKPQSFIFTSE